MKNFFFCAVHVNEGVVTASSNGNRYYKENDLKISRHVSKFQIQSPLAWVSSSFKEFYIEIITVCGEVLCLFH